jgi:hypothetical protein
VPHREGPHDGGGLKRLRWEMSLLSVELAPLTMMHDALRVHHNQGPIEPLSESFPDKSPWTGVMLARVSVDLTK